MFNIYLSVAALLIEKANKNGMPTNALESYLVQLKENMSNSSQRGDTSYLQNDRRRIIEGLIPYAHELFGISFSQLCDNIKEYPTVPFKRTSPLYPTSGAGLILPSTCDNNNIIHKPQILPNELPLTAWTRFDKIEKNYSNLLKGYNELIVSGDCKEAEERYWELLYFTGTRELWKDRRTMTKMIFKRVKKEKNYKECGMILAKGTAYRFMCTGYYDKARKTLDSASCYFNKAKAYSDNGIIFAYLADIDELCGDLNPAYDGYKEAIKVLKGEDRHEVYLKKMLFRAKHSNYKSTERIKQLNKLHEEFSAIKNYAEAIVDMELAKSYYALKDPEALVIARKAYDLLKNKIRMPRFTIIAKGLLETILANKSLK